MFRGGTFYSVQRRDAFEGAIKGSGADLTPTG